MSSADVRNATLQAARLLQQHLEQCRTLRDQLVVDCVEAGLSTRAIAAELGISASGISLILRRQREGRPDE